MKACCKTILLLFLLCIAAPAAAQIPQWAIGVGSPLADDARTCVVAPNGNVYLAGLFSGTMDLDPSAATYSITSNGETDIFLACYTSSGSFLWGLHVGGNSYDGALSMAADKDNNVVIAGFFSGQHVDFDPLSTGIYLNDMGVIGPVLTTAGDGFVAKYTPTGKCAWAIDLGDSSVFDVAEGVGVDEKGSVYVGGDFHYTMNIDPAGSTILNALTGTAYLVKYDAAGHLVWGFNFGGGGNGGVDNAVWDIKSDGKGSIYLAGCYQNTSNFSSTPVLGSTLANSGVYDGFLAKYDTAGKFIYVVSMNGAGNDEATSLAFDTAGNVYVTGYTASSSLTFDPSVNTLTTQGHGLHTNMFLAKYTAQGAYMWGHVTGNNLDDAVGACVGVYKNSLYCTGYFHDTVDFDPSAATAYLSSNGQADMYLCKYDLDGNYICGFNVGSGGNDEGRHLALDTAGYIYTCGQFTGINTNFSPGPVPVPLSVRGGGDAYVVKYNWLLPPVAPKGYLTGDTICFGDTAHLTFTATAGTSPYTILYTHNNVTDTVWYVHSGQQIDIPSPQTTTRYKLILIMSSGNCDPPGYVDTTATILVHPLPVITISNDTTVCPGKAVRLHVTGGDGCYWLGSGIDSPAIAYQNVIAVQTCIYKVVVTDSLKCRDTGVVAVNVFPALFATQGPQVVICSGDTAQLKATGADSYLWYPDTLLTGATTAQPKAWPKQDMIYTVAMTEHICGRTDTLSVQVMVNQLPDVHITEAHDVDCGKKGGMMTVAGAKKYIWYPSTNNDSISGPSVEVRPEITTLYYVVGTDDNDCSNRDSTNINVFYNGTGRLYAPTAFTPNDDGKNDCFRVNIPGIVTAYQFLIYNRWGQVVYATYVYGDCWDGKFQGVPQDMGTYFYSYKGTSSSCGSIAGKGDFQLIR